MLTDPGTIEEMHKQRIESYDAIIMALTTLNNTFQSFNSTLEYRLNAMLQQLTVIADGIRVLEDRFR